MGLGLQECGGCIDQGCNRGGERSSEDGRENVETTEEEEEEEEEEEVEEEGEAEEGKVKRRAEEDKDSYYKTLKMVKVAPKLKLGADCTVEVEACRGLDVEADPCRGLEPSRGLENIFGQLLQEGEEMETPTQ